MKTPISLIFLSLLVSIAVALQSQHLATAADPRWLLPLPELKVDPSIPTSQQLLGYEWGDEISSHAQIQQYFHRLADAAPRRTRLVQYGTTYEGRSLYYLVISSPNNIASLDQIRADNLKLADPRVVEPSQAGDIVERSPAVIWLAYAVHGNEISPSDAAMLTAYHLLADQRQQTKDMLQKLIVIIDPLQNPDGRDRFVNVYRETRGRFDQSHPFANEHTERWARGRTNHYWFDMNRDWFRHSQKEVQLKVAAYLRWQPQIYVDSHEMGHNSTYFFPPPADPKNPYLLEEQHTLFSRMGRHQASWFDRYGFAYMTREMFDAFYPGYGSEWPSLHGGHGVLWEQASARGRIIDRDDETTLTYHDGVRHNYISGLATLEFAAENRKRLLEIFHENRLRAVRLGREGDVKSFFIPRHRRPQRAELLATVLRNNGIEVRVVRNEIEVPCLDAGGAPELRSIRAGSFHVPVAQPAGRLLRALLDRQIDMDERFLRRQLERSQLRLPDEIYDVTAWSLPLAFDVECLPCKSLTESISEPWNQDDAEEQHDLPKAKVAYLLPSTDGAIRVAADLIQQGVRLHVSDEPFKIGGRSYDRGAIIVKVSENGNDIHSQVQRVCQKRRLSDVISTDTAYVEEGAHMGGPNVHWMRPPKILLLVESPTRYSSGHTWHLFDQVLAYPTTRINGRDFAQVDLGKFNTIVLPDGDYSRDSLFNQERASKLVTWVQGGGTLVLIRGATQWAAGESIGLIKNQVVKRKVPSPQASDEDSKSKPEQVAPDSAPGAFLRANIFRDHWITFGFDTTLEVFYSGRLVLSPTVETAGRSLVSFAGKEDLVTSGFCWPENLELLANSPYLVYRPLGKGHIVAFTDDPNFRAMYPSLQRLFVNAVMFGPGH